MPEKTLAHLVNDRDVHPGHGRRSKINRHPRRLTMFQRGL